MSSISISGLSMSRGALFYPSFYPTPRAVPAIHSFEASKPWPPKGCLDQIIRDLNNGMIRSFSTQYNNNNNKLLLLLLPSAPSAESKRARARTWPCGGRGTSQTKLLM